MSSSSRKRNRSASAYSAVSTDGGGGGGGGPSSAQQLPADSINPRSYSPDTLRQLAIAGLPQAEPLPSRTVRDFPHRPLPSSSSWSLAAGGEREEEEEEDDDDDDNNSAGGEDDEEEEGGADDQDDDDDDGPEARRQQQARAETQAKKRRQAVDRAWRAFERDVGVLAGIAQRSLGSGDVARARRAFGLLLRSTVYGRPVDLRHNGYWELGAEILLREGEQQQQQRKREGGEDEEEARPGNVTGVPDGGGVARRWGSPQSMPRVRAYYEDLIHRFPYNRLRPNLISALHFWPALLAIEFTYVYMEHKHALEALKTKAEVWDDEEEESFDDDQEKEEDDERDKSRAAGLELSWRDKRVRREKEKLRQHAIDDMIRLENQMDRIMQELPYSSSPEMLRLRAQVSLYLGDLAMPPHPRSVYEDYDGKENKEAQYESAKTFFRKAIEQGAELDEWTQNFIDPATDEHDTSSEIPALAMYSSLPIRKS